MATTENGVYFLVSGGLVLLLAGIVMLLRDTRGLAFGPRCRAMARRVWGGFVWLLPNRKWVKTLAVFLVGFLGGSVLCGAISLGLLQWYYSTEPRTGDERDAGLAILLVFMMGLALQVSLTVGFVVGMVIATRYHNRLSSDVAVSPGGTGT